MNEELFGYLEDFDNSELDVDEWQEVMEEALASFNEENETNYEARKTIQRYILTKEYKSRLEQ